MLEGGIFAGASVTVSLTVVEGTSFAFDAARKLVGASPSPLSTILALIGRRGVALRMPPAIGIAATTVGSACTMGSGTDDATTGSMFSVVRGEMTVHFGADATCSVAGVGRCCPNS